MARGTTSSSADRLRRQAEHAGLQAAHVEQVLHQPVEPVQRLVGGGQQLVAVLVGPRRRRWLRRLSTAALAEASGVRRSWLTAASSAVRIRSASASGLARSASSLRAAPGAARRRPGRRTPRARAGRRRPAAARAAASTSSSSIGDVGVGRAGAGARARRPTVATIRQAAGSRLVVRAARPRRRRSSRVTDGQAEGLAEPVEQRGQRGLAAQHAAGQGGQGLGLGAGAGRLPGTAGGQVDDRADRDGDQDEDDQGEQVLRLGDGQRCERRGEEAVEQQEAADGRGERRARVPPTSATPTTRRRNSRMSLGSDELVPERDERRRSAAAGPAPASAHPASRRVPGQRRPGASGRRRPLLDLPRG